MKKLLHLYYFDLTGGLFFPLVEDKNIYTMLKECYGWGTDSVFVYRVPRGHINKDHKSYPLSAYIPKGYELKCRKDYYFTINVPTTVILVRPLY
jgi:hypothetical protein